MINKILQKYLKQPSDKNNDLRSFRISFHTALIKPITQAEAFKVVHLLAQNSSDNYEIIICEDSCALIRRELLLNYKHNTKLLRSNAVLAFYHGTSPIKDHDTNLFNMFCHKLTKDALLTLAPKDSAIWSLLCQYINLDDLQYNDELNTLKLVAHPYYDIVLQSQNKNNFLIPKNKESSLSAYQEINNIIAPEEINSAELKEATRKILSLNPLDSKAFNKLNNISEDLEERLNLSQSSHYNAAINIHSLPKSRDSVNSKVQSPLKLSSRTSCITPNPDLCEKRSDGSYCIIESHHELSRGPHKDLTKDLPKQKLIITTQYQK